MDTLVLTQITLEFLGAIFCAIPLLVLRFYGLNKEIKTIMWCLGVNIIFMLSDAGAYLCLGRSGLGWMIASRICNCFVFISESVITGLFIRFFNEEILRQRKEDEKRLVRVTYSILGVSLLMILSNLYFPWVYSFDENAYYHREFGWYINASIFAVVIGILVITVIRNSRRIEKGRKRLLAFLLVFPMTGLLIQTFVYGISFIHLGMIISMIGAVLYILRESARLKAQNDQPNERERITMILILSFFLFMLFMGASLLTGMGNVESLAVRLGTTLDAMVFEALFPAIPIASVGIIITLLVVGALVQWRNKHADQLAATNRPQLVDELTGLLNINCFNEDMDAISVKGVDYKLGIVRINIDDLETIRKTKGDDAADELLLGVSACLRQVFGERGQVYRIGEESFAAIEHSGREDHDRKMRDFNEMTKAWRGKYTPNMPLSKGSALGENFPQTIPTELVAIAEGYMYVDRNNRYIMQGKTRHKK